MVAPKHALGILASLMKPSRSLTLLAVAINLVLASATALHAGLVLPHFFSDHMVLQRERTVAIWGTADADAMVRVSFKGKTAETKPDAAGRWKTAIETGPADSRGAELTITSGKDTITIQDVLVGEVWFASGQSNMVFRMKQARDAEEFIAKADFPDFRFFDGPNVTASEPQSDIEGKWAACTPETIASWSAVACFFAHQTASGTGRAGWRHRVQLGRQTRGGIHQPRSAQHAARHEGARGRPDDRREDLR